MNSRERIKTIISRNSADRCGFWLGNPDGETWPILHKYFGTSTEEQLRLKFDDDVRWFWPTDYQHPEGKPIFDVMDKETNTKVGPFANCKEIGEMDFEWPNPDYINFDKCIEALKSDTLHYRLSGLWTSFYHDLMDLFGMESYLMNMYLNPELVHAVTDRVCNFYYKANERFFETAGNLIDGFFFGNDFGTQNNLICGVKQFDEFILPWFKKFTDLAHNYGYQVILHSCGSIYSVIDRLIDLRVDCLHPLQAKAANMSAEKLSQDFKGRIAFMGGIDTQELLVNGKPEEVEVEVEKVMELLGPSLIVSPSHEAILPNVTPQNIEAMVKAVNANFQIS